MQDFLYAAKWLSPWSIIFGSIGYYIGGLDGSIVGIWMGIAMMMLVFIAMITKE